METTLEQNMEVARVIEMIKAFVHSEGYFEDDKIKYLMAVAGKMFSHANFQDSAAVLNPGYDPVKSDLIRKQAKGVQLFAEFLKTLKECQALNDKVAANEKDIEKIARLFL